MLQDQHTLSFCYKIPHHISSDTSSTDSNHNMLEKKCLVYKALDKLSKISGMAKVLTSFRSIQLPEKYKESFEQFKYDKYLIIQPHLCRTFRFLGILHHRNNWQTLFHLVTHNVHFHDNLLLCTNLIRPLNIRDK